MASAAPCAYCGLWRRYYPATRSTTGRRHYWDDAPEGPFGPSGLPLANLARWQNIAGVAPHVPQGPQPTPRARCAAIGLNSSDEAGAPPPPLRRVHWLHIPKTGSSFGTTLMHRGCPRIPPSAAADDGAPIVSLSDRYRRSDRRWCDRGAFLGNLNGHDAVRYPEHRGHTVALFREPRARMLSECAAIDGEFRRAFGKHTAAPATTARWRAPAEGPSGSRVGARQTHRRRRKLWQAARQARGGGEAAGRRPAERDEAAGATKHAAEGDAAGRSPIYANARGVYGNAFLREFLYSHGFSHRAIEVLRRAWNREGTIPLRVCLGLDGLRGCQTKMTLGVPCAAPLALNLSLLAEARRRVESDFLFVGLTAAWDASVCLFHALLGGVPRTVQFLNGRRGTGTSAIILAATTTADSNLTAATRGMEQSPRTPVSALLHDPWDEELYRTASARFAQDLSRLKAREYK